MDSLLLSTICLKNTKSVPKAEDIRLKFPLSSSSSPTDGQCYYQQYTNSVAHELYSAKETVM